MKAPGPIVQMFRDMIVIVGIALLCFLELEDFVSRMQLRREQQVRFAVVQQSLARLDAAYRQRVTGLTDLNQVVLRQNELLIEYQKLLLQTEYLPASAVRTQPQPAASSPPPATQKP